MKYHRCKNWMKYKFQKNEMKQYKLIGQKKKIKLLYMVFVEIKNEFKCKFLICAWVKLLNHLKNRWMKCFLSIFLYSQYSSLWSVSNTPLTPMSQNGGTNNGLGSQFLRGASSHYPSLSHSVTVPSSGSPLYDSTTATEVHDAPQYDTSPHGRLTSAWTPVTPPSL